MVEGECCNLTSSDMCWQPQLQYVLSRAEGLQQVSSWPQRCKTRKKLKERKLATALQDKRQACAVGLQMQTDLHAQVIKTLSHSQGAQVSTLSSCPLPAAAPAPAADLLLPPAAGPVAGPVAATTAGPAAVAPAAAPAPRRQQHPAAPACRPQPVP